jgi:hypothetical protein
MGCRWLDIGCWRKPWVAKDETAGEGGETLYAGV